MLRMLLYVAIAGAVIYGAVWLVLFALGRRGNAAGPARPRPPAPDDDPVFLAELDRKIRRERQQREAEAQRAANEQSATDTPPTEAEAPQPDAKPTDEDPPASDGQARPGAPTP